MQCPAWCRETATMLPKSSRTSSFVGRQQRYPRPALLGPAPSPTAAPELKLLLRQETSDSERSPHRTNTARAYPASTLRRHSVQLVIDTALDSSRRSCTPRA